MLANNEIGVIQPVAEIAAICRDRGVPVHCDATQGVGKLAVDVAVLSVDLLSFSAHKLYGPKGVGALYVRRGSERMRLEPLFDGGGQEHGLRSGTLNVPGIVGFAKAVEVCREELAREAERLAGLRGRLWQGLCDGVDDIVLNGPTLEIPGLRLPGNLNVGFRGVDGEALLARLLRIACSSGSACTSADPQPSHVLRAIGLDDALTRASLRFGIGRFNTESDIDVAIDCVADSVRNLRIATVGR
jgi:cysteine desulfurase